MQLLRYTILNITVIVTTVQYAVYHRMLPQVMLNLARNVIITSVCAVVDLNIGITASLCGVKPKSVYHDKNIFIHNSIFMVASTKA